MNNLSEKQQFRNSKGKQLRQVEQPLQTIQGPGEKISAVNSLSSTVNPRTMGHRHMGSIDLARQYERDIKQIERFLFRERDNQGRRLEKYLAHVRVIEDAHYPNRRPPEDSPITNKKYRFLILTVKISGRMRLHKARENPDGLIQIGRTWDFDELSIVEIDSEIPTGFAFCMGKHYYWETHSPKERRVWLTTVLDHYIRYTNGGIPQLIHCNVEYFHLEGLLSSLMKKDGSVPQADVSSRNSPPTVSSTSLGPHLSSQSQPLPRQRITHYKSVTSGSSSISTRSGTIIVSSRTNKSSVEHSPSKIKKSSIFGHSRHSSTASQEAKRISRSMLAPFKRSSKAREISDDDEVTAKLERQQYLRRQVLEEKKRQMDVQRRRQEEITEKKLLKEKLDRENQAKSDQTKRGIIFQQDGEFSLVNESQKHEIRKNSRQKRTDLSDSQPDINFHGDVNSNTKLERQKSAASSIKFVGHRQSHADIDKITGNADTEVEYDDFLGDYNDINDFEESEDIHTAPLRLSITHGLAKKDSESGEIDDSEMVGSIDGTLENIKYQSLVDTNELPADIKDIVSPDLKSEEVLQVSVTRNGSNKKNPLGIPDKGRVHARSRAFSRVEAEKKDSDFTDLFDEIGYDPSTDDYEDLKRKILKELERLQYHKVAAITETNDVGDTLKTTVDQALQQCSLIDHGLSLLSVQLSSFKDSVSYIEKQGHGLQVETTNKKLLKKELEIILHSADIPQDDLHYILRCRVSLDKIPTRVENILGKLNVSLAKINGLSGNTGRSQISEMQALKERHAKLDHAANLFVKNFKIEIRKIFKSMSNLLAFSGCLMFIKEISPNDFNDILVNYTEVFAEFYSKLGNHLSEDFNNKKCEASLSKFSFEKLVSKFVKDSPNIKNGTSFEHKNLSSNKILLELGLTANSIDEAGKLGAVSSEEKSDLDADADIVLLLNNLLDILLSVLSFQQEVSVELFSLSSSVSGFQSLISTDILERIKIFESRQVFVNSLVETDREMSDGVYELMKGVFGTTINTLSKCLFDVAKISMLQPPCIVLILQYKAISVASTDQEYAFSKITQLESRINTLWERQTEEEIQNIISSEVYYEVMNFSKAYAIYFYNVQFLILMFQFGKLPIEKTLMELSKYLWKIINDSLSKGIENMNISELSTQKGKRPVDSMHSTANDSSYSKAQESEHVGTLGHLTLLLNYTWVVNQIKDVNLISLDLKTDIDELRSMELSKDLVDSNTDPSATNSYSRGNIEKIIIKFSGANLKSTITELSTDLRGEINGRCYDSKNVRDGEQDLIVGRQVEKEVYNNCLNSFSVLYGSTYSRFNHMIKQYYNGISTPVDKIVINHNFNKLLLD
ncbi:hypothetical protein HII13_001234 [Brettanomyces bruxellensis]|nr:hypothetical protein HII13_001234 [Brettanomyces bruxellensis]